MKLTKDDVILQLVQLYDDINTFKNNCRLNGFSKEYVKLNDAQTIISNIWAELTDYPNIQSSCKSIKSSKYIVEVGNDEIKFDNIEEANETFRQAVENNDINTSIKIYVDEGYSNKHLKLMRSERGRLTSSRKSIKSSATVNEANIKRDTERILRAVKELEKMIVPGMGEYEQFNNIQDAVQSILGEIGAAHTIQASRKPVRPHNKISLKCGYDRNEDSLNKIFE